MAPKTPRAAKSPRRAASPKPPATKSPKPTPKKSPAKSRPAKTNKPSKAVSERKAALDSAREKLTLFRAPLTILRLFASASADFFVSSLLSLITSKVSLALIFPLCAVWAATQYYLPELYTSPDCLGEPGGLLYYPQLYVYEAAWWLVLGVLSSIGLGTGLHSGIMFLWPFAMSVITNAEACGTTSFSATYNHPCSLKCGETVKGGVPGFFNTLLLLWPSVVLWGSGTAIGELPPYFITRAAKRAGTQATDYEAELAEAAEATDIISKLKVWTISFTERHGFLGILLLASWPNAAFDMCGMACGWLEMPFWTFFGATLIGKGLVKVTLQSIVCIAVFGPAFWSAMLGMLPDIHMPARACKAAKAGESCTLTAFLTAGRTTMMQKFSLQRRMLPAELLGKASSLSESALVDKYCSVLSMCGTKSSVKGYANAAKHAEMASIAQRVMAAYDANGDGKLSLSEIMVAVGTSDGKLSLASLDPGTGGFFSLGNLWSAFIAGLVLFFIHSIVEQVALQTKAARDAAELEALEAKKGD